MTATSWFLVIADDQRAETQVSEFTDDSAAMDAYAHAEAEYRPRGDQVDVVLIASDDEEALRRFYPHLFHAGRTSKEDAIRMLSQEAYA